jgi:TonB family protein
LVHAVSATFEKFEHMSPPAAGLALLLHAAVAAFLIWAPAHHHSDTEEPIEVTMEAPPPPPEVKPEPKPEPQPEPPKAAPQPPPQPKVQAAPQLPGLAPAGKIGDKDTAPPMEKGLPTHEPPAPKEDSPSPPQQAMAAPPQTAPVPQPPAPTLEKELPPVEAPPAPLSSRDIPNPAPPKPEPPKPEPAKPEPPKVEAAKPAPPPPHVPPAPTPPQLAPSPLSRLPNNQASRRQSEQPRTTFVNPADTYAQNTVRTAYLQQVVMKVSNYRFDGAGLSPNDSVVMRFVIARNGSLLSIDVVRSSGKRILDRDAVSAFQQANPFPPLPSELGGDAQAFVLTFFPARSR